MKQTICTAVFSIVTFFSFAQESATRLPELFSMKGNWLVKTETRLSATGPWETTNGKATIQLATASAVIENDYIGVTQNKPFVTKTLVTYDHFQQRFQMIFVDSEHGILVDYLGEKKGDSLVFDKTWTYPNGSTVKLRVIYQWISPDEFTIENMRMPQAANTWDVTGRMKYTRSK